MSKEALDQPGETTAGGSWHPRLSWHLFLVAWILYEFTAQPALAAAITCAKFGWADWRSAFWLRRVDPDWRRGQTCFWFYLSYGLWKVALTASLVMLILLLSGALLHRQANPANGLRSGIQGILAAAGLGFGLSFFTTYVALWSAARHRVKIWLGVAPHRARTMRYWPPSAGQHNAAPFVTITSLVITLWTLVFATIWLGLLVGPGIAGLTLMILLALASPATMFVLKYLEQQIFARTTEECWPTDELGFIQQTSDQEAGTLDWEHEPTIT